jgi:KDO2-lipid IV(A) lauroyltransferase
VIRKRTTPKRFSGLKKWFQYLLARSLLSLLQILPLAFVYRLGEGVGWLLWKLLKRRRLIVQDNLKIVKSWMVEKGLMEPSLDLEEGKDSDVQKVFQRSVANLLSSFPLGHLPLNRQIEHIKIEGTEALKEALSNGKGAIVLLAHMGPWETLASLGPLFRHNKINATLGAMYRPLNNTYLDTWYRTERERLGSRMFSRYDGFREIFKFLKGGGIFAILADQRTKTGETSDFFGAPALTTPLLRTLRRGSDAPVFSAALYYDKSCKMRLVLRPVELRQASTRLDFADLTNRELEQMLAQDITGGFWLHRRFLKS